MSAKTYRADPENEAPTGANGGEAPADEAPETEQPTGEAAAGEAAAAPRQPVERDLEAEIAELKDRLTRAMAETENVRRRADRERQDALKYAVSPLAKDLLGVADNLRRALESVPADAIEQNETLKTLMSGVEMTEKEFMSALQKHGVQQMSTQPGDRFDPHYHEAMFEVPTDQQAPGTVVHVLQPGYMLHDRLLRAARVGVAKSASGQKSQGSGVDTSA
jgi:molecular chaperone GrpE